jgi:hypothetical protein
MGYVPLRALSPLILIALGAVAAVVIPGVAGTAIAIMLVGTGCVVAVSLAFWQIGDSEDRDRREGRS